ncbi:MAG: Asp-tRNA(Asn)/Glu-tRNA(Gln) amidotransferase subunit GatC [Bifidobacteriaceae bacterium]|jgi:aspartyl-tRNA(Asn)/glutamyl-tRNA(Gln) amidotransferase subunit C|nr:Asp-tRNA(Asn)/Glu-tRNA(Gln) amidotransferase subunit GatC [Bifidobacteriaceae bacterium]
MSEFTSDRVKHVAGLARIDLTDDEIDHLAKELQVIEDSINQLEKVANSNVPPTSHPIALQNVLRPDVPEAPLTVDEAISGAPEKKDNMFLSPQILDEE